MPKNGLKSKLILIKFIKIKITEMKIKNLIFASLAASQVGALQITEAVSKDCNIRTMVMNTYLDQYEGWRTYLQ
jgi:hypothetical protein